MTDLHSLTAQFQQYLRPAAPPSGGAVAKNIFWQVSDTVNLLAGSHFEGIILAQTNVAIRDGASVRGRLLAQSAVTLINNAISEPAP